MSDGYAGGHHDPPGPGGGGGRPQATWLRSDLVPLWLSTLDMKRVNISGYKMLPARRFEEAMRWLAEWHGEITGQGGAAVLSLRLLAD